MTEFEKTVKKAVANNKKKVPVCRFLLLFSDCSIDCEEAVFGFLKLWMWNAESEQLVKFLRFYKGADIITVDKITILFNEHKGHSKNKWQLLSH